MKKLMGSFLVTVVCLGAPSAASAGTNTATGAATMTVFSQCTITGANVSLGTFRTTDTIQALVDQIGYQDGATLEMSVGTNGIGTVPLGSVTCDNGTPYSITMESNGWLGSIDIPMPAGILELYPMVKKIGDFDTTNRPAYEGPFGIWPSPGNLQYYRTQLGTIANGSPQQIMGNLIAWAPPTTTDGYIGRNEQVGTAGVYSGSWTTTLNF